MDTPRVILATTADNAAAQIIAAAHAEAMSAYRDGLLNEEQHSRTFSFKFSVSVDGKSPEDWSFAGNFRVDDDRVEIDESVVHGNTRQWHSIRTGRLLGVQWERLAVSCLVSEALDVANPHRSHSEFESAWGHREGGFTDPKSGASLCINVRNASRRDFYADVAMMLSGQQFYKGTVIIERH
jgi:hypothetical protein